MTNTGILRNKDIGVPEKYLKIDIFTNKDNHATRRTALYDIQISWKKKREFNLLEPRNRSREKNESVINRKHKLDLIQIYL